MRMRTNHSKRFISVIIALSIVISMMSGFGFTSVSAAEAVSVSTWSALKTALESTSDVDITVTDNIEFTASDASTATGNCISITGGKKTLNLNGKSVSFMVDTFEFMEVSGTPKSVISLSNSAKLFVTDSVGTGILEYIAYDSDYFAFMAPKESGGLISVSGTALLNVKSSILNNAAIGPCVNVTGGSPIVTIDGSTLTTGSSLYSWAGGFALRVGEESNMPGITLKNNAKLLCSGVNAVHSLYSKGSGAMYIGNAQAAVNIASATLVGTVQAKVSAVSAAKVPFMSVATHSIKVDGSAKTTDASYLTEPTLYELSTGSAYFMVVTDNNGDYQTITTEVTHLTDSVDGNTYNSVVKAFGGANGLTTDGYKYNFNSDAASLNLISGTTFFKDKFTANAADTGTGISVTSDLAAKMTGFAQFYTDTRWSCASEMTFDLKMGPNAINDFAGFYVKYGDEIVSGTSKNAVFFANDGVRGDSANSTTGTTGIGFSFRTVNNVDCIEIFVKYLDDTGKLCVSGHYFYNVVDNLRTFNKYRVSDNGQGTITFYANDTAFASVVCSNAKVPTLNTAYKETYYSTAEIFDKNGASLATVANALVSTESALAFGTRNEIIEIDNIEILDSAAGQLKIDAKLIAISNNIDVQFAVIKANFEDAGFTSPTLKVAFGGEDYVLNPQSKIVSGIACYVFTVENIAPQMMGDNICATLCAERSGKTYESIPVNYSVKDYVYTQLNTTTDAKFRTLLVDMLRYGSAAQEQKSYKTSTLVDSELTSTQASWGTQSIRTFIDSSSKPNFSGDAEWLGMGLYLENRVAIMGYFDVPSTEGVYIKLSNVNGTQIGMITQDAFTKVTGPNGTPVSAFIYDDLAVNQLSEVLGFTVCNAAGEDISGTYLFSVESYVKKSQSITDTKLLNLINTMMLYGDSARAFAG